MTPNDVIAGGYRAAKVLMHRMIDDLTPADFHHQPVSGANSAAWIVGHLALTFRRTAERLGVSDLPAVDPKLADQLATTKKPAADQSGLGDPAALVKLFDTCIDKVTAAVGSVPAETLAGPPSFPGPFATNFAEGLLFGATHVAMHSGQLSTVRRSLGKPPVV